jgi:hypothetical protein
LLSRVLAIPSPISIGINTTDVVDVSSQKRRLA